MVQLYNASHTFNSSFPMCIYSALNKYPNRMAPHVVSVDVADRSIMPNGTIRTERILGIQQGVPKWIASLLNTPDVFYAREVSFVVPSGIDDAGHTNIAASPRLVMSTTNLTMNSLLECREAIVYKPHPWPWPDARASTSAPRDFLSVTDSFPERTKFSQSALIFSKGLIAAEAYPPRGVSVESPVPAHAFPAAGFIQRSIGEKLEETSRERFEKNADKGRSAMELALDRISGLFGWSQDQR